MIYLVPECTDFFSLDEKTLSFLFKIPLKIQHSFFKFFK